MDVETAFFLNGKLEDTYIPQCWPADRYCAVYYVTPGGLSDLKCSVLHTFIYHLLLNWHLGRRDWYLLPCCHPMPNTFNNSILRRSLFFVLRSFCFLFDLKNIEKSDQQRVTPKSISTNSYHSNESLLLNLLSIISYLEHISFKLWGRMWQEQWDFPLCDITEPIKKGLKRISENLEFQFLEKQLFASLGIKWLNVVQWLKLSSTIDICF